MVRVVVVIIAIRTVVISGFPAWKAREVLHGYRTQPRKYVSTPGVWGWQKTAENYCVTSHAKILYFHTDTLFGDLVAEDGTFNKLACHCRSKDECS